MYSKIKDDILSNYFSVVIISVYCFLIGAGCDQHEPRVYEIPSAPEVRELESEEIVSIVSEKSASPVTGDLVWEVPDAWVSSPPGAMQRALYSALDGSVTLSVSRFPGDVGGSLANVNRWKRQLGLPSVKSLEAVDSFRDKVVSLGKGQWVELYSDSSIDASGIISFWIAYGENTWFFKATGTRASLAQANPEILAWIESLEKSSE